MKKTHHECTNVFEGDYLFVIQKETFVLFSLIIEQTGGTDFITEK